MPKPNGKLVLAVAFTTAKNMKQLAVIGAGNVGSALGLAWQKAGYQVTFGVKDAASAKAAKLAEKAEVTFAPIPEAIAKAEVIILALPAMAVTSVAPLLVGTDKVVIDATNTVMGDVSGHKNAFDYLMAHCNISHLVKCFNSTGAENMANPAYTVNGEVVKLDMFCAGDSAEGKAIATELALAAGFGTCYDFGGNDKVELLEKFALAWINLAIFQKHGREMGFKLLKR